MFSISSSNDEGANVKDEKIKREERRALAATLAIMLSPFALALIEWLFGIL